MVLRIVCMAPRIETIREMGWKLPYAFVRKPTRLIEHEDHINIRHYFRLLNADDAPMSATALRGRLTKLRGRTTIRQNDEYPQNDG